MLTSRESRVSFCSSRYPSRFETAFFRVVVIFDRKKLSSTKSAARERPRAKRRYFGRKLGLERAGHDEVNGEPQTSIADQLVKELDTVVDETFQKSRRSVRDEWNESENQLNAIENAILDRSVRKKSNKTAKRPGMDGRRPRQLEQSLEAKWMLIRRGYFT